MTQPEGIARFGPLRRETRALLELFAISGLAVAQPVFDLLGKNAAIFTARRSTANDVVLLTLLIVLGPALIAYAVEVVVGLALPRARRAVHVVLVAAFAGLLALELVKTATEVRGIALLLLAVLGGVSALVLVWRYEPAHQFLRILAFAPVVFSLMFLFASPVSEFVTGGEKTSAAGVDVGDPQRLMFIVLDEFPLEALMDGTGHIDRQLYPNLAALADTSTWYRNTSTVSPYTEWAIPALLTGQYPSDPNAPPTAKNYPDSIFRLLGGVYRLNVHEQVQAICPSYLCFATTTGHKGTAREMLHLGEAAKDLWSEFASLHDAATPNFGRIAELPAQLPAAEEFRRSIAPSTTAPRFDFAHLLLPHLPWRYLPDLRDAGIDPNSRFQKANALVWGTSDAARVARTRFLLQAQATDRLVGMALDRLRELGVFDDTLVVVTADHGEAFRGKYPKRSVTADTAAETMWVPLLIKAPTQTTSTIDDRPMQSVDVLPTIADILDVKIPWKVDGVSALGLPRAEFDRRLYQWDYGKFTPEGSPVAPDGEYLTFPGKENFARVLASKPVPDGPDPALRTYGFGPYASLVGQVVQPLIDPTITEGPIGYGVDSYQQFNGVDTKARSLPWTRFEGWTAGLKRPAWLAFAVNGRVAGLTRVTPPEGQEAGYYVATVAPQFFVDGNNWVVGYAVTGDPADPHLKELPAFENERVDGKRR